MTHVQSAHCELRICVLCVLCLLRVIWVYENTVHAKNILTSCIHTHKLRPHSQTPFALTNSIHKKQKKCIHTKQHDTDTGRCLLSPLPARYIPTMPHLPPTPPSPSPPHPLPPPHIPNHLTHAPSAYLRKTSQEYIGLFSECVHCGAL